MRLDRLLWIAQGLLALLFLFAGGMKLVLPIESMAGPVDLPGWFLRFLGVARPDHRFLDHNNMELSLYPAS